MTKEKVNKFLNNKKLKLILIPSICAVVCIALTLILVLTLSPKKYTVYLHQGTQVTQYSKQEGEVFSEPSDIQPPENYLIDDWYTEPEFVNKYDFSQPITADVHLYLKTFLRTITIMFADNTPADTTLSNFDFSQQYEIEYGQTFTLPSEEDSPTCSSDLYQFSGWIVEVWDTNMNTIISPGQTLTVDTPNDTIVLTASWKTLTQTVQFDLCGGAGKINDVSKNYGEAVTLPDSILMYKSGYTFVGWALSPDAQKSECLKTQEQLKLLDIKTRVITLYAIWEEA